MRKSASMSLAATGLFLAGAALSGSVTTATIDYVRSHSMSADPIMITDPGMEGLFVYDSSDTVSSDNLGTVLKDSGGKRFKRVVSGPINAKWFGAKSGDATFDNSVPVNNAIKNMSAGQELLIDAGDYYFANKIVLTPDKQINFKSLGVLHMGLHDGVEVWGKQNVYIEDIRGNETAGAALGSMVGQGVALYSSNHAVVTVNYVAGFKNAIALVGLPTKNSQGVLQGNGVQYSKVEFGLLKNNLNGVVLSTSGNTDTIKNWVNENTITGGRITGGNGVLITKGTNQHDPFNGNKFYNIGFETLTWGIKADFAEFDQFIAPRFESVSRPIYFNDDCKFNIISNTHIDETAFFLPDPTNLSRGRGKYTTVFGHTFTVPNSNLSGVMAFSNGDSQGPMVSVLPTASENANKETYHQIANLMGSAPNKRSVYLTSAGGVTYHKVGLYEGVLVLNVNSGYSIGFPDANLHLDREVVIKNAGTNSVVLNKADNGNDYVLAPGNVITVKSDGTNWQKLVEVKQ